MLIGLNKIPQNLFMAPFATPLLSILEPNTNSDPSLGLELGLGLGLRRGLGVGLGVGTRLRVGVGVGVRVGFQDSVEVQSGQILP